MEETNIYEPLTEGEYNELKLHLEGTKNHLPEHLMSPFWSWCNRIRGERVNQPCSCPSSAKHWGNCVTTLREYTQRIQNQLSE